MEEKKEIIKSESTLPTMSSIENMIYVIRGQQVMLDRDLAKLYGVETRVLNQAVKRNIERFPEDFLFRLDKEECLRSQIVTLKEAQGKHLKYLPFAFSENGVAMLSSVLKSKTAIEVNIRIMRAFNAMRSFLMNNATLFKRLETVEHHQLLLQQHAIATDNKVDEILKRLDSKESEPLEGFFFEGQIFDAYTLISDFVRNAKERIILIDNYIDDRVLKILSKRMEGVSALVYTDPRNEIIKQDIKTYNRQYPPVQIKNCRNVHDRYLIIDHDIYFIGGSIKDLGKKIVAFCKMHRDPKEILDNIK